MEILKVLAHEGTHIASYKTIASDVRKFVKTFQNVFNFDAYTIDLGELTTIMMKVDSFVCEYARQYSLKSSEDKALVQFVSDLFSLIKIFTRTNVLAAFTPLYSSGFFSSVVSIIAAPATSSQEVSALRLEALRVLQNLTIIDTTAATRAFQTQLQNSTASTPAILQLVNLLARGPFTSSAPASEQEATVQVQGLQHIARILTFTITSSALRPALLSHGIFPAAMHAFLSLTAAPATATTATTAGAPATEQQALAALRVGLLAPSLIARTASSDAAGLAPATVVPVAVELLRLMLVCCSTTHTAADLMSYVTAEAAAKEVENGKPMVSFKTVVLSKEPVTFTENHVAISEVVLFTLLHAFMKRASAILGLGVPVSTSSHTLDLPAESADAVEPPADAVAHSIATMLSVGLASGAVVSAAGQNLVVDVAAELSDAAATENVKIVEPAMPSIQEAPDASLLALKDSILAILPYFSFTVAATSSAALPPVSPALPLLLHPASVHYLLRAFATVVDTLVPPTARASAEAPRCALTYEEQVMLLLPPVQTLLSALRSTQAIRAAVRMFLFGALGASDPQRARMAADERIMVPAGAVSEEQLDNVQNMSFRARVLIAMLHPNSDLALMVQEIVYLACGEDTEEYIRLCGFGRAVGLLANKGLPGFTHLRENAIDLDDFVREYERSQ